ncbi:MAG: type II toxin-antitoxin system RelE/ParE family toxin [Candidatus Harrisonbacteria bacterium]|nr:type II toxin-antitoxin system RelE/ParE family toxin [Candidatus Harrisonbacteria bacterium]
MTFEIFYHYLVAENDIPKLPTSWKKKIRRAIDSKLATRPDVYGKPLRRSLKNYRKLRVGDYRVIFKIEKSVVRIFVIQHRSVVYAVAEKRVNR